jgi:Tol biopolymer transport system component
VTRRLAGVCIFACVLLALSPAGASAEAPAGPRLAVVKWDARFRSEVFTSGPLGSAKESLYAAGIKQNPSLLPFTHLVWSPDGGQIAFTADIGEENLRFASFPKTAIALDSVEGGKPTVVPGTKGGSDPVFAPDGNHIAFAKERRRWKPNEHGGGRPVYDSVSIWLADLSTGAAVQLTPWHNGLRQSPSSFSPDGAQLALTRVEGNGKPQAVTMAVDSGDSQVVAPNASEPVFSPDGSMIAFLRGPSKVRTAHRRHGNEFTIVYAHLTDVYVEQVDGGELRRLTDTPNAIEFGLSWDPSGQQLIYTQIKPFAGKPFFLGFGDAIREINVDGSCATTVFSGPKEAFFSAAWRPGPGREAGPIAC